jgi:two-component system, NarL family, response regulator DegU
MENIKLAITDDHKLFRQGLISIFQSYSRFKVVIEAEHGQDLLDKVAQAEEKPDVVLIDIAMPVMDGIETTIRLKKNNPEIKIITISMHNEEQMILKMLDLGANGYLLKSAEWEEVLLAIDTVMLKDYYFNDFITQVMFSKIMDKKDYSKLPLKSRGTLTARELEALELICQGYNSAQIAEKMFISKRTVEFHRQHILDKLEMKNTASLIVYALQHGLVQL